MFTQ